MFLIFFFFGGGGKGSKKLKERQKKRDDNIMTYEGRRNLGIQQMVTNHTYCHNHPHKTFSLFTSTICLQVRNFFLLHTSSIYSYYEIINFTVRK